MSGDDVDDDVREQKHTKHRYIRNIEWIIALTNYLKPNATKVIVVMLEKHLTIKKCRYIEEWFFCCCRPTRASNYSLLFMATSSLHKYRSIFTVFFIYYNVLFYFNVRLWSIPIVLFTFVMLTSLFVCSVLFCEWIQSLNSLWCCLPKTQWCW